MIDNQGRTVIGWLVDDPAVPGDETGPAVACDAEADNWLIDWVGTEPPGSVWAAVDDRPDEQFRVWPLNLNADTIPAGTMCRECGADWTGTEWRS